MVRFLGTNAAFLTIAASLPMLVGASVENIDGSHWPGVAVAGLVLLTGILMLFWPDFMTTWGTLAIVLGAISFFTNALGGFILGLILVILGGIYARRYRIPDLGGSAPGSMVRPSYLPPPPGWASAPVGAPLPSSGADGPSIPETLVAAPPFRTLLCPKCGGPTVYVAQYSRYYCPVDQSYV